MLTRDDITGISVIVKIQQETTLFILLDDHGSINRIGSDALNEQNRGMFIGVTRDPLFQTLRSRIPQNWFSCTGMYTMPDRKGRECELIVAFKTAGGGSTGIGFQYGSESQGPPSDICAFVHSAVELTEPWYQAQLAMVKKSG